MTIFTGTNGPGADFADASGPTLIGFTPNTPADLTDGNDDQFDCLGGDDEVHAGSTNDTLTGGAGTDELDGGDGDDIFIYNSGDIAGVESVDGGLGTDTLRVTASADFRFSTVTSIEQLVFQTTSFSTVKFFDTQVGSGLSTALAVTGDAQFNEIDVSLSGGSTTVNLSGWTFTTWSATDLFDIFGNDNGDTITGTIKNDFILGGTGIDSLTGGDGDDSLAPGNDAQNDTIDGGLGSDTVSYLGVGSTAITFTLSTGGGGTAVGAGTDTLIGIENLRADGGDDLFIMSDTGNNTLIGGGGSNTVSYASATNAVTANLGSATATGTDVGTDTFQAFQIQNVIGGSGSDTLTGNSQDNILIGGAGQDTLDGKDGSDIYSFGAGDVSSFEHVTDTGTGVGDIDAIRITGVSVVDFRNNSTISGIEKLLFTNVTGTETAQFEHDQLPTNLAVVGADLGAQEIKVFLATNASFSAAAWTFTTWEATDEIMIFGDSGAETITGSSQNDMAEGGDGGDIVDLGGGSDTYQYSAATEIIGDQIGDTGSSGTDTLALKSNSIDFSAATIGGIEALSFATLAPIAQTATFNGSQFGAGLISNSFAVAGINALQQDIVVNNASSFSAAGWSFTTWEATDTVTINGAGGADTITGASVKATLNGLAGDDTLISGVGNDILDGGANSDTASYQDAGAAVTVSLAIIGAQNTVAAGSDTLSNIENLTGSAVGGDTLTGDGLANVLKGLGGDDTLNGGGGSDTVDGGTGNDTLTGGAGGDVFKLSAGNDTIADFGARYFTASLDESQQVSPTGSPATGSASLVLNRAQTALTLNLSTLLLDFDGAQTPGDPNDNVSGFHIHAAPAGANGIIVWDIQNDSAHTVVNPGAGTVTSLWTSAEGLTGNLAALFTDGLYLNIHTTLFGGGAIRGQIDEVAGGHADKIDLTSLNIGSFATWQAITADVAGSAKMTTMTNGVAATLTITGVTEAMFTAADFIFAGNVANTMNGAAGADDLFGAGGNDRLNGQGGNDRLFGETGNDTLNGGIGIDTLNGALGRDIMIGGAQRDVFDFNVANETGKTAPTRDIITDFSHAQHDQIDLNDIDASTKTAGNQNFKFIGTAAFHHKAGELHYVLQNPAGAVHDKTIVEGDVNGDGKADFQIELSHLIKLAGADFHL